MDRALDKGQSSDRCEARDARSWHRFRRIDLDRASEPTAALAGIVAAGDASLDSIRTVLLARQLSCVSREVRLLCLPPVVSMRAQNVHGSVVVAIARRIYREIRFHRVAAEALFAWENMWSLGEQIRRRTTGAVVQVKLDRARFAARIYPIHGTRELLAY